MVGGLLVSQVLTLFTTPVVYLFFDRLARSAEIRSVLPCAPPAAVQQVNRRVVNLSGPSSAVPWRAF